MSNEDKQAALSATVDIPLRRFDFTDPDAGGATMGQRPDGWWVTYDEAMTHTAAVAAKAVEEATKDMVPLSADAKSVFLDGFGLLDIVYPSAPQQHAQADRHWVMTTPENGKKVVIWDAAEAARFAAMDGRAVFEFVPAVQQHAQAALSDEQIARALWAVMREHEDRCDMELEDMGKEHHVWEMARAVSAILATRQPAPAAFVPGGLQALVDMTGQPAMYGDTEVLPKAAPVAADVAKLDDNAFWDALSDYNDTPMSSEDGKRLLDKLNSSIAPQPPADAAPVDAKLPRLLAALEKQVMRLNEWRLCMSHNSSYFGEPNGLVKSCAEELEFLFRAHHREPSTAQGDVLSQQVGSIPTWHDRLEASGPAKPAHDDLIRSRDAEIGELRRALSQRAASQDSERDADRWQFMVEVSAGPPALNTYAAALNEQPLTLHETPATRKAAFIAAVDKARQKMAEQQAQEGGAA